jgi:XRE family aerobic/anaerobic benzoate catabolism transcriptional regulator
VWPLAAQLICINAKPCRLGDDARLWGPHVTNMEMLSPVPVLAGSTAQATFDGRLLSGAESEFLKQMGDRLRLMRLRRSLSRRELSRRSEISERYIARIEAGQGNVSIVLLLRLAQALAGEKTCGNRVTTTGERLWESLF